MFIPSKIKVRLSLSVLFVQLFFLSSLPVFSLEIKELPDFDGKFSNYFSIFDNSQKETLPVPYYESDNSSQTQRGACEFSVTFINVGQGDSEFIVLPNCKTVLIDGGPSSSASSNLAKFLTGHNISSIDYVVLTHPHTDHFKGLQYVFDNLSVSNFYDTKVNNPSSSTLKKFRDTAAAEPGINIFYPVEGQELDWAEGVKVKILNSCSQESQTSQGEILNNCSIVMKMTYQNVSMLFMGDAQGETENLIADKYRDELRSDVLKVGHHGSSTSSSEKFLSYVSPKLAYISVGKNSYGHPSDATLGRLENIGARVFRTDRDGTSVFIPGDKIFYCEYPQQAGF